MAGVFTRIATAPSEDVYEELDMTDQIDEVRQSTPRDRDITMENWFGEETKTLKAMKREIRYKFRFIDQATFDQLQKWKHNRTRLRPFPMYGKNTVLYHSLQRSLVDIDGNHTIGTQIPAGVEPTFTVPAPLSGSGLWTFPQADGTFVVATNDQPRYHPGPYGLQGIVVDSQTTQLAVPSHQDSSTTDWTARVGSPTVVTVQNFVDPLVIGQEYTTHAVMAAAEEISYSPGTVGTVASNALAVWIKGQGFMSIRYVNISTPGIIKSGTSAFLTGEWDKFVIEDIDLSGVPNGDVKRIEFLSATAAQFFIGPVQFNTLPYVDTYIHAQTGGDTQLNPTTLQWDTIRIPDTNGSIIVSTKVPGTNQATKNSWIVHRDIDVGGTGERFGIFWKGGSGNYTFQKNNTQVPYTTSKSEGDDIVIAASWDLDSIRIYEDGVLKGTTAYDLQETTETGLYIGDAQNNLSSDNRPVATIRMDNIALSDAEMLIAAQNLTLVQQREWTIMCDGRDFEIGGINTSFVDGNNDKYQGSFVLREKTSLRQSTTELA